MNTLRSTDIWKAALVPFTHTNYVPGLRML